jgi:hypothetical protein
MTVKKKKKPKNSKRVCEIEETCSILEGSVEFPGGRSAMCGWFSSGSIWIFGGYGYAGGSFGTNIFQKRKSNHSQDLFFFFFFFETDVKGFINEMWEHANNKWTLKGGGFNRTGWHQKSNQENSHSFFIFHLGVYGIQGEESSNNIPGARYGSACWVSSDGDLWLFGGLGFDTSSSFEGLLLLLFFFKVFC